MASLYRRHRPRTFADVVGQEHVVRTLRNALEQGRVHHAHLFVGSRGTGKTSMAKILAAALNCERGPTVEPCGVCDSCVAIASATSLDVIEMDAASNNSVDDIRDLRERVAYAPVAGRHKVYILDEAHMLSTAAWNAFLKTLEEPPPHTIFVLATTEPQKVLPTVADRCHRFDFSRPTVRQIAGVLRRVADAEGISIPDEACALIARSATGSFRDALGTLEQLLAYSGREIALDDVLAVLGAADSDLLFETVDAIASGAVREALLAAARLAESGRDVARFFADLEAHARSLMVVQALGGEVPPELAVTAEHDARMAGQAARVAPADVTRLLDLLAAGLRAMKDGADARTQLELALVKAADPARDPSVKALLARLERLEGALAGRRAAPPVSGVPAAPAVGASRAPEAATVAGRAGTGGDGGARVPGPAGARPSEEARGGSRAADRASGPTPAPRSPEPAGAQAEETPREDRLSPSTSGFELAPPTTSVTVPTGGAPAAVAAAPVAPQGPGSGVAVAVATEAALDPETLVELWPAVLQQLGSTHLGAFLAEALPVGIEGDTLTIAWTDSAVLLMKQADRPANRDQIAAAIRAVTGRAVRLAYELRSEDELEGFDAGPARLTEDELVARFVAEFDATELPPEEPTAEDA